MHDALREKLLHAHAAVKEHGAINVASKATGIPYTTIRKYYTQAMVELSLPDVRHHPKSLAHTPVVEAPQAARSELAINLPPIQNGTALAFSDCHWTSLIQPRSLAHEALLILARHLKPGFLFCVGDALDMGSTSRHLPLMWSDVSKPKVKDELAAGQTHLRDLREAAGDPECYWIRGNHDDRFDKYLAAHAAAFEGMGAFTLADWFQDWRMCWRLDVGDNVSFVHRFHNGVHAGYNNAMKSARTVISGDTHALEVKPWNNWTRRLWGVQCGMIGDPAWPCFNYRLAQPGQQQPGFVVLTWKDGELMTPEPCEVVNGAAWFRGEPVAGRVRVKAGRAAA
jgi:hypothetical protein